MSLATQFDQTREEITERYRRRIELGDRTKLTRDERETLTVLLLDQLIALNQRGEDTRDRLQALYEAEKALLEEGYPQGSINSVYLPAYTRVLKEAIAQGRLLLTEQNSYAKPWTKLDGSETGMTQTHYALDFLTAEARDYFFRQLGSSHATIEAQIAEMDNDELSTLPLAIADRLQTGKRLAVLELISA